MNSNIPTPDIIENHRTLVLKLISLKDENSDEARMIRRVVKKGNDKYHELEQIYTQLMSYRENA